METKYNVLNGLKALDSEITAKDLTFWMKEFNTIRIKSFLHSFLDEERSKFKESFFLTNDDLIINKIKLNKNLNSAISELSKVYNSDDINNSPLLKTIIVLTENFIKNLVDMFLSFEINYLFHLKEVHKNSNKASIVGELLNFELETESITINELYLDNLLNNIGTIVQTFSILLRLKNSEWLEEFFKLHKEKSGNILSGLQSFRNNNIKAKVGKPGKFESEEALHRAICKIQDWKKLSLTELAKRLGYKSGSGLQELLKSKKWKIPK